MVQSLGVLPKQLGRGVRPASQNSYPIYDQNLRFSLFMTWPKEEGKKKNEFKTRVQKSIPYLLPQWWQNGYNRYPIYDQNGWKTIPFGAAHTYIAHIREYPPGGSVCLFWYIQRTNNRNTKDNSQSSKASFGVITTSLHSRQLAHWTRAYPGIRSVKELRYGLCILKNLA